MLVVEDDIAVADVLCLELARERHDVDVAYDGTDGLERAQAGDYDALIIDVMLPGIDGLEVVRQLRAGLSDVPVLMLSACDGLRDRLHGFDAGADDYLTKPFAFEELLARLRAITRRNGWRDGDGRLAVGDLVLDRAAHEVLRAGLLIQLAPKEFDLLEYLMCHPGQVLSRTMILERVSDLGFGSFTNVVDTTIRRLRKAMDMDFDQLLIHTVRGVGYKIKAS